jgi:hypothetical protein
MHLQASEPTAVGRLCPLAAITAFYTSRHLFTVVLAGFHVPAIKAYRLPHMTIRAVVFHLNHFRRKLFSMGVRK